MGGFNVIGTADVIAHVMQAWFEQGACDGFNLTPLCLPGGCDDFVDLVIPVLQERGLFRTAYDIECSWEHKETVAWTPRWVHPRRIPRHRASII